MKDPLKYLLQEDVRSDIEGRIDTPSYVRVHHDWMEEESDGSIASFLMPKKQAADSLEADSWDGQPSDLHPGCNQHFTEDGATVTTYYRFGSASNIEPLVIRRNFHGMRDDALEILEEFRLFHNLYFDSNRNVFLKFDDAGNEHEVIRMTSYSVDVARKELKQFLAMKDAALSVCYDIVRYSASDIAAVAESERHFRRSGPTHVYSLDVLKNDLGLGSDRKNFSSYSRLLGKVILQGTTKERSGMWPYDDEPEDFPDFILGVDPEDRLVRHTCDPSVLNNYFGTRPGAPHYLSRIYFRQEVLQKYYANPDKYTISDGALHCGGLWMLRLDNNNPDYVIAYLGDLGRDLPASERTYWLSYNIPPKGPPSQVTISRDFLAVPAEPERADLLFRYRLIGFSTEWANRWGWDLFRPLREGDTHLLRTLRIPMHDTQAEFDDQVLALTKILVDSLNEKELTAGLSAVPPGTKGIGKLDLFLQRFSSDKLPDVIKFFRDLQELRSCTAAHRKGSDYDKVMSKLGLSTGSYQQRLERLLLRAISAIEALEKMAINTTTDKDVA